MMQTIIGNINNLDLAVELLKKGEVVAFPTETVYGLGADAKNIDAVNKIFIAKGRPQDNPLIVHIGNLSQLKSVAKNIPQLAYTLFENFSPGPLTIILEKADDIPYVTTAGLDTVGIRIPDHNLTLELLNRSNIPIAGPSANTSGKVSPTLAEHVFEDMNGKINLILDGGKCSVGIESTIIDLTKEVPKILRPGAITAEMFLEFMPKIINFDGKIVDKVICPGMKYTHYKPICECKFCDDINKINAFAKENFDKKIIVLGETKFVNNIKCVETFELGSDISECMKNIYHFMRQFEKDYDVILVQRFIKNDKTLAIMDRLEKSTGGESL